MRLHGRSRTIGIAAQYAARFIRLLGLLRDRRD
jgi:hypothetical protein